MNNVISLATRKPLAAPPAKPRASRKAAPAPERAPTDPRFNRIDDLPTHLFEPGYERNGAAYMALFLAQSHAKPNGNTPRNPFEALRKTRRALAILEIECAELARAQKEGGRP